MSNHSQQNPFFILACHFPSEYSLFEEFTHEYIVFLLDLTLPYPFPFTPINQQLSVCFVIPSPYIDEMYLTLCILSHSFFLSLVFPAPSNSPTTYMHEIYMCVCDHVFVCLYICLLAISSTHIRKHTGFVFLSLAYFT
jgi:hypothetical protein